MQAMHGVVGIEKEHREREQRLEWREAMKIIRVVIGIALFFASSWISAYLSDVLAIPEDIAFLSIGGILAFAGGIVFYSGVRTWRYSYPY